MFRLIVDRVAWALPMAFLVLLLVLSLLEVMPGDPVTVLLGEQATPADYAAMRAALGLDKPFTERISSQMVAYLQGDWGQSVVSGKPVLGLIGERLGATLQLAVAAMLVAVAGAATVGTALGLSQGFGKKFLNFISLTGMVTPSFVLGPILIGVFAVGLGWVPVAGKDGIQSLFLPALTLGMGLGMVLARFWAERLEALLTEPSLQTARAKGATLWRCVRYHALPQGLGPVLQVFFLQLGMVLTGAVLTEAVFGWPGVGALLVDALHQRDYPLLQGCLLLIAWTYMVCILASDVLVKINDSRI